MGGAQHGGIIHGAVIALHGVGPACHAPSTGAPEGTRCCLPDADTCLPTQRRPSASAGRQVDRSGLCRGVSTTRFVSKVLGAACLQG